MPMIGPPHLGRSVRENCRSARFERNRSGPGARRCPSYIVPGAQRPRGTLSRNGDPPRKGRVVRCRVLVATPSCLRSRADPQVRMPNCFAAIPIANRSLIEAFRPSPPARRTATMRPYRSRSRSLLVTKRRAIRRSSIQAARVPRGHACSEARRCRADASAPRTRTVSPSINRAGPAFAGAPVCKCQ